MSSNQPYRSGNWRGIIDPQWQEALSDLDQWLHDNPGVNVVDKKSRTVSRVETPDGAVYVKIIHRLQERGSALKMFVSGIKWLLRPSRAIATFRITDAMLEKGIGCPKPISRGSPSQCPRLAGRCLHLQRGAISVHLLTA